MANHHRQIIESREFYSINSILVLWQKLLQDDNDDLFGSGKGFATEGVHWQFYWWVLTGFLGNSRFLVELI